MTVTTINAFSGDWEWQPELECYETAYRAVRFGQPWNGFVTPVVTRDVLDAFMARQRMLAGAGETVDQLHWDEDGTTAVVVHSLDGDESRLVPDADGNYDLAPLGWTFDGLDLDDTYVLRTIG